jgi:hypothetical protein
LCAAIAAGCSTPKERSSANQEGAIREVVTAYQAALKARDGDKIWSLLDSDSQADADRAAKATRDIYAKASAEQKAEQQEALGLSDTELTALTGAGFLKSKRFHGKYHEVPDSTITGVTVQGDKATVNYTEQDGDKEQLKLFRQDGRWKLSVEMPKVSQP